MPTSARPHPPMRRTALAPRLALLLLALLLLGGCPGDGDLEDAGLVTPGGTGTSPGAGNGPIGGGVATGSNDATPAPTPTPTPEQTTPPATPKPTAPPKVAIASVQVSSTYLLLYPVPLDPTSGLGYPTDQALTGVAMRSDGFQAAVHWVTGEHLTYQNGRVSTKTTTPAGIHLIRCEALDDPNVYKDVAIEVRTTGDLSVIVQ